MTMVWRYCFGACMLPPHPNNHVYMAPRSKIQSVCEGMSLNKQGYLHTNSNSSLRFASNRWPSNLSMLQSDSEFFQHPYSNFHQASALHLPAAPKPPKSQQELGAHHPSHPDSNQSQLELINTVPFKDSNHYESLTKLNRVVQVT